MMRQPFVVFCGKSIMINKERKNHEKKCTKRSLRKEINNRQPYIVNFVREKFRLKKAYHKKNKHVGDI